MSSKFHDFYLEKKISNRKKRDKLNRVIPFEILICQRIINPLGLIPHKSSKWENGLNYIAIKLTSTTKCYSLVGKQLAKSLGDALKISLQTYLKMGDLILFGREANYFKKSAVLGHRLRLRVGLCFWKWKIKTNIVVEIHI